MRGVAIERLETAAYRVPTETPESDGTLRWTKTTLVAVHVHAAGCTGFGYTYADAATAQLIRALLNDVVCGRDVMDVPRVWEARRSGRMWA